MGYSLRLCEARNDVREKIQVFFFFSIFYIVCVHVCICVCIIEHRRSYLRLQDLKYVHVYVLYATY